MQSIRSFGAIASRSIWYFQSNTLRRGIAGTSTPYRTADPASYAQDKEAHQPAVPIGMPQETKQKYEPETGKAELPQSSDDQQQNYKPPVKATEPLSPPKPPHSSSPRLEITAVHNPAGPTLQQRRSNHHAAAPSWPKPGPTALDGVSCTAGIDPGESARADQEEENRQYYKSHKASPLAEIEVADTRKPITRATDGYYGGGGGADVVLWRPEQLDTAEEALRRATEIWRRNAERGDPDSPHGRVIRALRGEYF